MFFIISFSIAWTAWLILADKSRWRELFIVGIFASLLGTITDLLMLHFKYWHYHEANTSPLIIYFFDDFSLYIVVPYLFIQWLPRQQTFINMVKYFFIWTALTISTEFFFIITNHMDHYKGWNLGYSYLADWGLFWIFYQFHKIFKLEKLRNNS